LPIVLDPLWISTGINMQRLQAQLLTKTMLLLFLASQ